MRFNARHEMYIPYEHSSGRYLEILSYFETKGRVMMSASGVMKRIWRVASKSFPDADVSKDWLSTCFYTRDGVAPHPDGRAKLVLDAASKISAVKLYHGVFPLSLQEWEELPGIELGKERVKELVRRSYSHEEAKQIEELQFLAQGSKNLGSYLDAIAIASDNPHPKIRVLKDFSPPRSLASLRPLEINCSSNIIKGGSVIALGELDNKTCISVGESKKNGKPKTTLEQMLSIGRGKVLPEHWPQYVAEVELLFQKN